MSQKRACKQYSAAFKEEAVALVIDQGCSVPDAAKALGIGPNLLYRWRENSNLRMEKEILKKTSFSAKEMK